MDSNTTSLVLLVIALWTSVMVVILAFIAENVPEMVMDEVFHVPQTQKYCDLQFWEWDQKITTFPGTYVIGAIYGRLLHLAGADLCSLLVLRSVNVLLGAVAVYLVMSVVRLRWPSVQFWDCAIMAVAVCCLPTHFFFQFLFYTDVAGLVFLLACYERSLLEQWGLSALAAAASILCRQTNVVWVAFICGASVLHQYASERCPGEPPDNLFDVLRWIWQRWGLVCRITGDHAAVTAAFAAFVIANGGVAVGDREAHRVAQHTAQLPYLCLFSVAAFLPLCARYSMLMTDIREAPLSVTAELASYSLAFGIAVYVGSVAHPYLLADNRHYTFYLWKNILGRSTATRLALSPLYAISAFEVFDRLTERGGWMLALGFWVCAGAALVPAGLLELRYFTAPAVLFAVQLRPPEWRVSAAQLLTFAAVNAATLYVFAKRPFLWPDGSVARFMW